MFLDSSCLVYVVVLASPGLSCGFYVCHNSLRNKTTVAKRCTCDPSTRFERHRRIALRKFSFSSLHLLKVVLSKDLIVASTNVRNARSTAVAVHFDYDHCATPPIRRRCTQHRVSFFCLVDSSADFQGSRAVSLITRTRFRIVLGCKASFAIVPSSPTLRSPVYGQSGGGPRLYRYSPAGFAGSGASIRRAVLLRFPFLPTASHPSETS